MNESYRPLLDLIGHTEGTDKGRGYNETLAYGAYTGGEVDLVHMTLDQIDHLQTSMLQHPKNKWNSSALGRYQIVRTTLRKLKGRLRLSGSQLFDAKTQDTLACELLKGRGIVAWETGSMSESAFINNLAKEWASLPTMEGVGFYGGQHAAVSVDRVRAALEAVRAFGGKSVPVPPPPGIPKPPVAAPVAEKPTLIGAILKLFRAIARLFS